MPRVRRASHTPTRCAAGHCSCGRWRVHSVSLQCSAWSGRHGVPDEPLDWRAPALRRRDEEVPISSKRATVENQNTPLAVETGQYHGRCCPIGSIPQERRGVARYQCPWQSTFGRSPHEIWCEEGPTASRAYPLGSASHSRSFDHRRRPEMLRTAIATAFFWPTSTTSFLPRVTPV